MIYCRYGGGGCWPSVSSTTRGRLNRRSGWSRGRGRVKVFIVWSGDRAKEVALALYDWLPQVIQAVKPFVSERTIPLGAEWHKVIIEQATDSDFAIICATREGLESRFLNFETGLLVGSLTSRERVCPLLIELDITALGEPLSSHQAVRADCEGIRRLITDISQCCPSPLDERRLDVIFDKFWPDLDAVLSPGEIAGTPVSEMQSQSSPVGGLLVEAFYPCVSLEKVGNHDLREDYARAPVGHFFGGTVPYFIEAGKHGCFHSGKTPIASIDLSPKQPGVSSVFALVNSGHSLTSLGFSGREIGRIVMQFDDGLSFAEPLVLGRNIREWAAGNSSGRVVDTVTDSHSTQVWEGESHLGKRAVIDQLEMPIPEQYRDKKLESIVLRETPGVTPVVFMVFAITLKQEAG